MRTQLLVAELFKEKGWVNALSAGAGRSGVDVLGLPGLSVEVKARGEFTPLSWIKQAEGHPGLAIAVSRPNGLGEQPEKYLAHLRLGDLIDLLLKAGYLKGENE